MNQLIDWLGPIWTGIIFLGLISLVIRSFFKHYNEGKLKEFLLITGIIIGGFIAIIFAFYLLFLIAPKALS